MNKLISTRLHSLIDYLVAILFITVPCMLDFTDSKQATWIFIVLGMATLFYSLFTDYEAGIFKLIPMPVHLSVDAASALLLAVSPWLLGFYKIVLYRI